MSHCSRIGGVPFAKWKCHFTIALHDDGIDVQCEERAGTAFAMLEAFATATGDGNNSPFGIDGSQRRFSTLPRRCRCIKAAGVLPDLCSPAFDQMQAC